MGGSKNFPTIEILKFEGTSYYEGEFPFTILQDEGIVVIPVSPVELRQRSLNKSTEGNVYQGVLGIPHLEQPESLSF